MSSEWIERVEAGAVEALRPGEVQPERVRQQHPGDQRGDRRARAGRAAARRGPRPGGPAAAPRRRGRPASARAVKKSPSAAIEKATATSTPSSTPSRSQRPGGAARTRRQISSGTSQPAVQFRWALACDTMPGEKPMKSPPTAAASGLRDQVPGEQPVPGDRGGGQVEGEDHQERRGRPDQVRQRREDHRVHGDRGVDREVHPVRDVDQVGEERVLPVGERVPAEGQQPLEERLVAGVDGDRPAVRVPPQPAGHPGTPGRGRPPPRAGRRGGPGGRRARTPGDGSVARDGEVGTRRTLPTSPAAARRAGL